MVKKSKKKPKKLSITPIKVVGIIAFLICVFFVGINLASDFNQRESYEPYEPDQNYTGSDFPPEESAQYNVRIGAIDSQKHNDTGALASDLYDYFSKNGAYPSFVDFNSKVWRINANLPNSKNGEILCDPLDKSGQKVDCELVNTPSKYAYSYQTWQADGKTPCNANPGQTCPKYTLTTILLKADNNYYDPDSVYLIRPNTENTGN